MAVWQATLTRMLRFVINDIDSDTYSDSRLEELLLIAAHFVKREASFDYDYVVDIDESTLSPDCVSNRDYAFINLVVLKAAVLLTANELKTKASSSIQWGDGVSSLNTTSSFTAFQKFYEKIAQDYTDALLQHAFGAFRGRIVTGPLASYDLNWNYTNNQSF